MPGLRGKMARQARRHGRRRRTPARRWSRRCASMNRSRTCSGASSPTPASSMPATRPTRRGRNSTATRRSASPTPRPTCCSSRSNSTASTTRCSTARWTSGPLAHYRPWIEDIRREKPYQLDDRLEQLFHEKSVTGRSAWNRLFDETISAMRFKVNGRELTLEPTLNLMQDPDGGRAQVRRRRAGADAGQRTCARSRSSPTRSPRTRKSPTAGAASRTWPTRAICPTASSARWWMRSSTPCATPIRACRIAITS